VAGYLPHSEGELFRARPGTNRDGVFPPSALLGEEKIIYETRARIIGLHPVFFWTSAVFLAFMGLVASFGVTQLGGGAAEYGALGFVLLLGLGPFLVVVGLGRRTSYAITDQRVVSRVGDTYDSVPLARVEGVRIGRGSSTIVFNLAPDPSDPRHRILGSRPPTLEWKGIPGAPGVATYANSAVKFYQIRQRQKQMRDQLVSSSMEDRIACEYCGALISVSSLQSDNPRCPRCAAPILVAPLGI
jgi:hypothetical protein